VTVQHELIRNQMNKCGPAINYSIGARPFSADIAKAWPLFEVRLL